jgi:hypothetical protein
MFRGKVAGSWKTLSTKVAPLTVASNAVAQQPFQFDSRAYEKENETEAEVGSGCEASENGKLTIEEQCTLLPSDDNKKTKVQKMPAIDRNYESLNSAELARSRIPSKTR